MVTITPQLLRFDSSSTPVGQDAHAPEAQTPVTAIRSALAQAHERDVQETVTQTTVDTWEDGARMTRQWMDEGVAVIQHPFLEADFGDGVTLSARPDRIVRAMGGVYTPVLIKPQGGLDDADELVMDLYCALAGATHGQFWLGDPVARRILHRYEPQRLSDAVARRNERAARSE